MNRKNLKIKKFYTRECVLLSFNEPTKYYDGKFPDDSWEYWETPEGKSCILIDSAKSLVSRGYKPLTKFYYNNWVGNMIFGVLITDEEVQATLQEEATAAGAASVDEYVEKFGGTMGDLKLNLLYDKVYDFIIENALITES